MSAGTMKATDPFARLPVRPVSYYNTSKKEEEPKALTPKEKARRGRTLNGAGAQRASSRSPHGGRQRKEAGGSDNDGDDDLFVLEAEGRCGFVRNDSGGQFVMVSETVTDTGLPQVRFLDLGL